MRRSRRLSPFVSLLCVAAAGGLGSACTAENDTEFVKQASSGGLLEVQLGRYAAQNAVDPQVRQFGQRMVEDHGKANETLAAIAQQAGIQPATQMNDEHRRMLDDLTKNQGAEFDEAYMEAMVDDHEEDVAAFRKQADDASSEVDRWAAQTLPTLEAHLQQARDLNERIGQKGSESSR
jgi:putative membrane protein